MRSFYQAESAEFQAEWARDDSDPSHASNKRIRIASWLSAAWELTCEGDLEDPGSREFFKSAFTSTGYLVELDNPSAKLKMKGLEGYTVEGQFRINAHANKLCSTK